MFSALSAYICFMVEGLDNLSKEEYIETIFRQHNFTNELQNENEQLINKNKELAETIARKEHQIQMLQKLAFGKKSERVEQIHPPEQTRIEFEDKIDLDLPQDIEEQKISYTRRKPKKIREDFSKLELPADLDWVETTLEPAEKTDDMVWISNDVTELLAIAPQTFYGKRIIRPKYSKPGKEGVVQAPIPPRPLQGAKIDVSLVVEILIDKYFFHMPLHRILRKYELLGMKLNDSTIGDWAAKGIQTLEPLFEVLMEAMKRCGYLQADETPIKVLDKLKKHATHLGYYWGYHDVLNGLVLFDYNASRGKIAPGKFLEGYSGHLQTDGYSVYDALNNENLILVACMAHARRKYFDAQENDKVRATWMLEKIKILYEVEEKARNEKLNHEERRELRKKESKLVLDEIKIWLNENQLKVLPRSPIGIAINYMAVRWQKLILYIEDGKLEIDNNLLENEMRPVALGRKNYLFAGSHAAAYRAGIIYSFFACCKKNGYDPRKWLEETLIKLCDCKMSELSALLPVKKQDVV